MARIGSIEILTQCIFNITVNHFVQIKSFRNSRAPADKSPFRIHCRFTKSPGGNIINTTRTAPFASLQRKLFLSQIYQNSDNNNRKKGTGGPDHHTASRRQPLYRMGSRPLSKQGQKNKYQRNKIYIRISSNWKYAKSIHVTAIKL